MVWRQGVEPVVLFIARWWTLLVFSDRKLVALRQVV